MVSHLLSLLNVLIVDINTNLNRCIVIISLLERKNIYNYISTIYFWTEKDRKDTDCFNALFAANLGKYFFSSSLMHYYIMMVICEQLCSAFYIHIDNNYCNYNSRNYVFHHLKSNQLYILICNILSRLGLSIWIIMVYNTNYTFCYKITF